MSAINPYEKVLDGRHDLNHLAQLQRLAQAGPIE
jgi:hypothetical protein